MSLRQTQLIDVEDPGYYGLNYASDTASHTPPANMLFFRIEVVAAATFSVLTPVSTAPNGGNTMTGVVYPAGTIIKGRFSAFTLSLGSVIAYQVPLV